MKDRIIHRGPDAEGQYVDDDVALGFRRLSFVDVKSGNQPIFNEDGSKAIEFNGEIYNFEELREELIKDGHTFKTHADTEVILHGYEQWGKGIVNRLRGCLASSSGTRRRRKCSVPGTTLGSSPLLR